MRYNYDALGHSILQRSLDCARVDRNYAESVYALSDHIVDNLYLRSSVSVRRSSLDYVDAGSLTELVYAYLHALEHLVELRHNYPGWKSYLGMVFPVLLEATGFTYAAFASRVEGSSTYIMEGEYPPLLLEGQKSCEFSIHNDIIGWVFRNEEAVYSDGFSGPAPVFGKREGIPSFGSTVCIPVTVNKSTCGVLCLAMEEARSISDELKAFLRLAADDLARLLEVLSLRYRIRMAEKASGNK